MGMKGSCLTCPETLSLSTSPTSGDERSRGPHPHLPSLCPLSLSPPVTGCQLSAQLRPSFPAPPQQAQLPSQALRRSLIELQFRPEEPPLSTKPSPPQFLDFPGRALALDPLASYSTTPRLVRTLAPLGSPALLPTPGLVFSRLPSPPGRGPVSVLRGAQLTGWVFSRGPPLAAQAGRPAFPGQTAAGLLFDCGAP